MKKPTKSGLFAVATATQKTLNQDACGASFHPTFHSQSVYVADGVGSSLHAEKAAQFACKQTAVQLSEREEAQPLLKDIFVSVQENLTKHFKSDREITSEGSTSSPPYSTTLICATETAENIDLAYLGNGAILHFRGNFNEFPKSNLSPWSIMNLMNPHSVCVNGREALTKYLSLNPCGLPATLSISKDNELYGDILVICTDGIYSQDHLQVGRSSDGRKWMAVEETLSLLTVYLSRFFGANDLCQEALEDTLADFLRAMKTQNLMDDDSTLGVIITQKAIDYQTRDKKASHGADNENNIAE